MSLYLIGFETSSGVKYCIFEKFKYKYPTLNEIEKLLKSKDKTTITFMQRLDDKHY